MDVMSCLNKVVDYIEENLTNKISEKDLARNACIPYFQLNNLFTSLTGYGLREYIRLRRLSEAAQILSSSRKKVIDIALDAQYSNPEAFTRAFRKVHGVSPSMVRKGVGNLVHFPKVEFTISVKGTKVLNYHIDKGINQFFIGRIYSFHGDFRDFASEKEIWYSFFDSGDYDKLKKYSEEDIRVGVIFDVDSSKLKYSFLIGVKSKEEVQVDGYDNLRILDENFACFKRQGLLPNNIDDFKNQVYLDWFLNNTITITERYEIEQYQYNEKNPEESLYTYMVSIN